MNAHKSKTYHLGYGKNVTRLTLDKAIGKFNYRIFEEFTYHLIKEARELSVISDFELNIKSNVYAFDYPMIDLCLNVFW